MEVMVLQVTFLVLWGGGKGWLWFWEMNMEEENKLGSKKWNHYSSESGLREAENAFICYLIRVKKSYTTKTILSWKVTFKTWASYSITLAHIPPFTCHVGLGFLGTNLLSDHLADMTLSSNISKFNCGHSQNLASHQEISFESRGTGKTYHFTPIILDWNKVLGRQWQMALRLMNWKLKKEVLGDFLFI